MISKRKKPYRIFVWIVGILTVILLPYVIFSLMHARGAIAAWYDNAWLYRKDITVSNSGGTLTNEDVIIQLDTATLVSAGKLQSNCNDIRVVDSDETTAISYWIEAGCNTATQLWARIPSVPNGGKTIYVYYGNSGASNAEQTWSSGTFTLSNAASCPSGWSRDTNFDNKFPYGGASSGATGGSASHNHGHVSVTSNIAYDDQNSDNDSNVYGADVHSHTIGTNIDTNASVLPPYLDMVFCAKSTLDISSSLISMFAASVPTGWTRFSGLDTTFPRGASSYGGTGGSNTHTHTFPGGETSSGPSSTIGYDDIFLDITLSSSTHTHVTNSGTTAAGTNTPPYLDMIFGSINSSGVGTAGMITIVSSLPPLGWTRFTSLDSKIPRGNSSYGGVSATSTHTHSLTITTGYESSSTSDVFGDGNGYGIGPHTHTATTTTDSKSNLPPYYTTVFAQRKTPSATTSTSGSETGQPVSVGIHYTFDEGYGTTVNNSISTVYPGTLSGATTPSWQQEGQCVAGKCLSFNGTTAYVNVSASVGGVKTISFWVNPKTNGETLVDFDGGTHYISASAGTITASGFATPTVYVNGVSGGLLVANTWQHVEVTTATAFTASNITIGKKSSTYFSGFIDEFAIDTSARTAAQVKADYNARSLSDVAVRFGPDMGKALSSGLVGYWKMDESSGNPVDSSGNGVTLTNNGTTAFGSGKFGNAAGPFNGSSRYFSTGTTISGVKTVSFWVYPAATTDNFINLASGKYISASTGTLSATGFANASIFVNGVQTTTIAANSWQLVMITTETVVSADAFEVGRANGSYGVNNSYLDEVRVYNRTLSPAEIQQLYNWAPGPVGEWKFDENTGVTAQDTSGNGATGSFTGTPMWVTGKFGSALQFNGSSQAVTATIVDPAYANTVEAWIYPTTSIASKTLVTAAKLTTDSSSRPVYGSCTGTAISLNQWTHIAAVSTDATHCVIYQNGVLTSSSATTGVTFGTSVNIAASSFEGKMDDVKIYNYVRTLAQIIENMNGGHPAPGSPVGSALIHYRFDEGYGSAANNTGNGGSALNGTITNGTWTNSGKFGKALTFGATTSVTATVTDPGYTNTISLWVYPTTSAASKTLVTSGKLTTDGSSRPVYGGCTGTALSLSTWTHLVVVSNGSGSCTIYQNGVQTASSTSGVTFGTSVALGSSSFTGIMDEVKLYTTALTIDQGRMDYNQGKASVMGSLSTDSTGLASNSNADSYCPPGQGTSCTPPVAIFSFDENTGTSAYDSSGNGVVGSLGNGTADHQPTWVTGKFGSALRYDGVNDTVYTPDSASLRPTGNMTIEAWIYPEALPSTTGDSMVIVGKYNSPQPPYYTYLLSIESTAGTTDGLTFWWSKADGTYYRAYSRYSSSGTTLQANQWSHVVGVREGASLRVYINGVNVTTYAETPGVSDTGLVSNSNLKIGRSSSSTERFKGKIDEIKVYDYARTQSQVVWDYNRGGPVGWWKFDECTGSTIYDASPNMKNGTIAIGATGTNTSTGTCSSGTSTDMWNNGTSGKFNASLHFDGTDDYASVLTPVLPTGDFSFSFWVNLPSVSSNRAFLMAYGNADNEIRIRNGSASTKVDVTLNNAALFSGATTLSINTWYHLVLTRSGSTVTLYLNGKADGTGSDGTALSFSTCSLYIGVDTDTCTSGVTLSQYMKGQIDNLQIFNYALTQQQINLIRNAGAVRFGP
jgi:hypothetical protein